MQFGDLRCARVFTTNYVEDLKATKDNELNGELMYHWGSEINVGQFLEE